LIGPEVMVALALVPGLGQRRMDALLSRIQSSWASSEILAARIDSLGITLSPSET